MLALLDGVGIIIYLFAWFLIPLGSKELSRPAHKPHAMQILGGLLVILGFALFIKQFVTFDYIWPLLVIVLGIYFIVRQQ